MYKVIDLTVTSPIVRGSNYVHMKGTDKSAVTMIFHMDLKI